MGSIFNALSNAACIAYQKPTWVVSTVGIHVHLAAPRWMPIDRALQPRQRRADKFTFEKNFMGIGQLHSAKRRRRSEQRLLQMPLARGVHVLRWNVCYITTTAIMELGCHLSRDFSINLSKEEWTRFGGHYQIIMFRVKIDKAAHLSKKA